MKKTIIFVWMVLIVGCSQNKNQSNESNIEIKKKQLLTQLL